MTPLVSVAIPVYNAEKTIEMAVKSVMLQTYQNWELIIVNDGSSDGSMTICKMFSDPRIRIHDDGVNRGLVNRLNGMPEIMNGKYLARMDADDMMHPERLERQVRHLEENPSVDILDCAIYTIDENDRLTGKRNIADLPKSKADVLKKCLFTHPAVLGKREWFYRHRYDNNYYRAEDYELWLRAFDMSHYDRIKEPLLYYREGNVNVRNYVSSMKSVRKILRRYGPSLISSHRLGAELLKSYLKQCMYVVFGTLRMQRLLAGLRNSNVEENEFKASQSIFLQISKINKSQIDPSTINS